MKPPEIRYTRARDGTRVSYTRHQGAGTPVFGVGWPGSVPAAMAHEVTATQACADAANWAREHGVA
jgi:hypothetical protein